MYGHFKFRLRRAAGLRRQGILTDGGPWTPRTRGRMARPGLEASRSFCPRPQKNHKSPICICHQSNPTIDYSWASQSGPPSPGASSALRGHDQPVSDKEEVDTGEAPQEDPCPIEFPAVHTCVLSPIWLSALPRTVAFQAPQSMGFLRQEYWSSFPFPPLGNFPWCKDWTHIFFSAASAGGFFTVVPPGKFPA